jgi:hypothetical protein
MVGVGLYDVVVGKPAFDPSKEAMPRHMMPYEGAKQMHIDLTKQMRSPGEPLTRVAANVFGVDARLHPITGMVLEQGHGALSADQQAVGHFQLMCTQLGADVREIPGRWRC